MDRFEVYLKTLRLTLIEIGWRRAVREIERRGYSVPESELCDRAFTLSRHCKHLPGTLPGHPALNADGSWPSRGICFAGAQWTGEWEVWGWDAEGVYWSVERKVRRSEAHKAMIAQGWVY